MTPACSRAGARLAKSRRLIQQLIAPIAMHMLIRPATPQLPGLDLPDLDTVCDTFTDTFVRAVTTAPPVPPSPTRRKP